MTKYLILGARGMLGQALAEAFGALASQEGGEPPVLWDIQDIDITDGANVLEKIRNLEPRIILNAAAYTDVDGAESNREVAFAVNEQGVRNVAGAAASVGASVVHYSTDYVFAGDREEGYAEGDSPGPAVNVYGESKMAGERALVESNVPYYLIRTAWLYGPYGGNFVNTMLRLGSEQEKLAVVSDQCGSPTYTKDLAAYTCRLLTQGYEPGIYHGVNAGVTTWFDYAKEIFRLARLPVKVRPVSSEEFPRPARRPAFSVLKNTKGPAMREWQLALEEYLKSVL